MHITKGRKRSRGQKDAREKHSLQLWIISYKHCPWHGYGYLKEARSRIHYRELISAAVGELRERFREEGPNLGASDPPECSVSSHHTRRARRCEESRLCVPRRCRAARAGPGHGSAAAPQMALAPAPLSGQQSLCRESWWAPRTAPAFQVTAGNQMFLIRFW